MTPQQPKSSSIDWLTLVIYFVFVTAGLFCIYASVYKETHPDIFDTTQNYGRQLVWIGISVFIGLLILLVDEKFFYAFAYPIYGITILMLIAVLILGTTVKGSSSWIEIGGFRMQPAEFAKFGTALALAKFLGGYNVKFSDKKIQYVSAFLLLLPMAIILLQNETGSALVFASFIFVLYREGLPGYFLFIGFMVAVFAVLALLVPPIYLIIAIAVMAGLFMLVIRRNKRNILIVWSVALLMMGFVSSVDYAFENILQPHQRSRINVLLGKEVDLKGAGYNVQQSKIAIGSGGLWGKGFLEGTQNKFRFVPEQSTDFIFCTIGEEYGFVGSVSFIAIYLLLLWRILYLAERQRYKFNRIYGYCVAGILFFHFAINIGMTLGLVPVIGIPLPFFSYGGSALLSFTVLLFIFIRLDSNRLNELRGAFE
ncbi:MAG: rod shape-determining protein RodA [Bacteroidota bacterium]|jgi:rod shape determining protein RodA|nr:rod shape-determining protein RodA [Sphingobacteriales bacterium]